jgi:hypothetical protein
MTDQPILEPLDERHIDFYGDDVTAVLLPSRTGAEPQIYVPIKPICDYLGLSWPGQSERIRRDPVLSDAMQLIRVTRINSRRGNPESLALPLDMLPGWLFGINAARVREELREKIIRYQRECFRALWNAFKHDILPPAPVPTDLAVSERSGAELALDIATAIQHLAQQQLSLERSVEGVHGRVDSMARFMRDFVGTTDRRLSALELHLNPQEQLTEAQAGELALAVKAVAAVLSGPDRRTNGYPQVYAELYRRYRISSYKNLPQGKFEDAMTWLHQWHQELMRESTDT